MDIWNLRNFLIVSMTNLCPFFHKIFLPIKFCVETSVKELGTSDFSLLNYDI